jgi:hypothetical protein
MQKLIEDLVEVDNYGDGINRTETGTDSGKGGNEIEK